MIITKLFSQQKETFINISSYIIEICCRFVHGICATESVSPGVNFRIIYVIYVRELDFCLNKNVLVVWIRGI